MIKIELGKDKKSKTKKETKVTKSTKSITPKKQMEFSKRLLIYDYFIALILLVVFFLGLGINGIYTMIMANRLLEVGMDISSIATPIDLAVIGTILGIWAGQLAVSSGAYYIMSKSDHKIQLPIRFLNELPKDIQDKVDMTQVITSVLSYTDN